MTVTCVDSFWTRRNDRYLSPTIIIASIHLLCRTRSPKVVETFGYKCNGLFLSCTWSAQDAYYYRRQWFFLLTSPYPAGGGSDPAISLGAAESGVCESSNYVVYTSEITLVVAPRPVKKTRKRKAAAEGKQLAQNKRKKSLSLLPTLPLDVLFEVFQLNSTVLMYPLMNAIA